MLDGIDFDSDFTGRQQKCKFGQALNIRNQVMCTGYVSSVFSRQAAIMQVFGRALAGQDEVLLE